MLTPPTADLTDDDFELAFIEIIDDRLVGLRAEMYKLSRFRERLLARQEQREVANGTRAA
jgi:hypothetical protein